MKTPSSVLSFVLMIALLGTAQCPAWAQTLKTGQVKKAASPWPIQIRAQVSYEPAAFPSEGNRHLFYEVYLTNFSSIPVALNSVEVVDATEPKASPLAHFTGRTLDAIAQIIGRSSDDADSQHLIPAGGTLVLFMEVKVPDGSRVPRQLAHRLSLDDTVITTAAVQIRNGPIKVLGRPVTGGAWLVADGPGNDPDNHHRRGLFMFDGSLTDSRRLAIDWKIVENGKSYKGDEHATASYLAYGKPLLAIADAVVVRISDGHPDNPPGHGADFHPSVPITINNVGGNYVILDLGDGQYAHYFHMRAGSLRVKVGDHVRLGQLIGAIGSSGDAREPHVHLEITNAAEPLRGEGIPYVIDHYSVLTSRTGERGPRDHQLPLDGMTIDFGR